MTDFGERLKKAMEDKNISASELSRQSGVGKNLISYYIHGKCLAKQDKVYMLAKALNVDPGWLITGKGERQYNDAIIIENSETLGRMLRYMTPEDYDYVIKAFNRARDKMRAKGIDI